MAHLLTIFITVFLAELGDKTQLAALLFATDSEISPFMVFVAASLALVASTGIAVVLGNAAGEWLTTTVPLKLIAGIGFIGIGIWTVYGHFTGA